MRLQFDVGRGVKLELSTTTVEAHSCVSANESLIERWMEVLGAASGALRGIWMNEEEEKSTGAPSS
jgi:hypothetical protein